MIILGVDPGSRLLGYGLVEKTGNCIRVIDHGTIELYHKEYRDIPVDETTPSRLREIHEKLGLVIREHRPHAVAVEKVFFAKNAISALKLGQARGVVLLTAAIHDLEIYEYSVTEVKSMITGHGRADKEQVAKMLGLMLGATDFATFDASDALALAVAHAIGSKHSDIPALPPKKAGAGSLKAVAEARMSQSRKKPSQK